VSLGKALNGIASIFEWLDWYSNRWQLDSRPKSISAGSKGAGGAAAPLEIFWPPPGQLLPPLRLVSWAIFGIFFRVPDFGALGLAPLVLK